MFRRLAQIAAFLAVFALAGAAYAGTVVSFYSHGWGMGQGMVYFPHAFVLIVRTDDAGDPPTTETYGYTAVAQDPSALMGPTPGQVIPEEAVYLKRSTLHFSLEITEAQYQALKARVAAWAAPGAPPYNLDGHNCITFVAELAASLDLATPPPTGRDPGRFLEGVRELNLARLTSVSVAPPGGHGG